MIIRGLASLGVLLAIGSATFAQELPSPPPPQQELPPPPPLPREGPPPEPMPREVEPPVFVDPQQKPARSPAQNVRLEIAVTVGKGSDPAMVFQAVQVLATGRAHSVMAQQEVPIQGGGFRNVGLSVGRLELAVDGQRVFTTATMDISLPPPAPETPEPTGRRPMPARVQQQVGLLLESGKRVTVSSVQMPGVTGAVGVHLTATVLP